MGTLDKVKAKMQGIENRSRVANKRHEAQGREAKTTYEVNQFILEKDASFNEINLLINKLEDSIISLTNDFDAIELENEQTKIDASKNLVDNLKTEILDIDFKTNYLDPVANCTQQIRNITDADHPDLVNQCNIQLENQKATAQEVSDKLTGLREKINLIKTDLQQMDTDIQAKQQKILQEKQEAEEEQNEIERRVAMQIKEIEREARIAAEVAKRVALASTQASNAQTPMPIQASEEAAQAATLETLEIPETETLIQGSEDNNSLSQSSPTTSMPRP